MNLQKNHCYLIPSRNKHLTNALTDFLSLLTSIDAFVNFAKMSYSLMLDSEKGGYHRFDKIEVSSDLVDYVQFLLFSAIWQLLSLHLVLIYHRIF